MRRTARPWLILALAAVTAFISDYSGPDVGPRLMLLLIAAAIITAIQNLGTHQTRPHSPEPESPVTRRRQQTSSISPDLKPCASTELRTGKIACVKQP